MRGITQPTKVKALCERCSGSGYYRVEETLICFRCQGTGKDPQHRVWAFPLVWDRVSCDGWHEARRKADDDACKKCGG